MNEFTSEESFLFPIYFNFEKVSRKKFTVYKVSFTTENENKVELVMSMLVPKYIKIIEKSGSMGLGIALNMKKVSIQYSKQYSILECVCIVWSISHSEYLSLHYSFLLQFMYSVRCMQCKLTLFFTALANDHDQSDAILLAKIAMKLMLFDCVS